jgi:hypothetical protein
MKAIGAVARGQPLGIGTETETDTTILDLTLKKWCCKLSKKHVKSNWGYIFLQA